VRSKVLLAGFALAFGLLACEQIIGLNNFHKCDYEIDCGARDASDESDAGDAADVFVIPDGASEASSWPHWRMDNAQFEVDSGATDASLATFVAGNGVLADQVSKTLIWKTQLGIAATFDEAVAFCNSIKGRLPTRIEAATLLDSTRKGPPYITPAFDAVVMPDGSPPPLALWTSSFYRPVTTPHLHFWFAHLAKGDMFETGPALGIGVLCLQ